MAALLDTFAGVNVGRLNREVARKARRQSLEVLYLETARVNSELNESLAAGGGISSVCVWSP